MNRKLVIAAGVAALLWVLYMSQGTVASLVAGAPRYSRADLERFAKEAAEKWKVPLAFMRALAAHETGWDQHAVNLWHPGDIARGGAWGIMQITEKTARMYGYTASVGQLLDARVNFELGGRILADGRCQTLQDAGAWWNAGRRRFEDLPADHVTRKAYVPKLLAAAEKDKKGGVA